jgi:hypothetical protein
VGGFVLVTLLVEELALRAVELDRPGLLHRVDDDPDEEVKIRNDASIT